MQTFSDYYNIKRSAQQYSETQDSPSTKDSPHLTYGKFLNSQPQSPQQPLYIKPSKSSECLVLIPMYKTELTRFEERNLQNTYEMLSPKYDICLLVPENLNTVLLIRHLGFTPMVLREKPQFFRSKETYSLMLERPEFYERLSAWKYTLIIQPDVWLFRTSKYKLEDFFSAEQIYIGAPWKQQYAEKLGIPEDAVGNGGLSLRNNKELVHMLKTIRKRNYALKTVEDQFISYILYHSGKMCPPSTGMTFSIDNNPDYWHKQCNTLPMGVHLSKPEFQNYWKPFIEKDIQESGFIFKHQPEIIVSLTSFKERLKNDAPKVIENFLKKQTRKPDRLILSVYKDDELLIPESIRKNPQVEIIVWPENLRPHLKYYPAMLKYPDEIIITIDDDQYYYPRLLEDLYNSYMKHPDCISAARCHCITFTSDEKMKKYNEWKHECKSSGNPSMLYFATGVGGVLYPPGIFRDKLNTDRMKDFITTDDIYLKDLEMQQEIPVIPAYSGKPQPLRYINTKTAKQTRLCDINTTGMLINDQNLKKCNWTRWTHNNSTNNKHMTDNNKNLISAKKIVYTVISGNYDTLRKPTVVTPGWTYICFTDQNIQSDVWTIKPLPEIITSDKTLNQVKRQRIMKICPHLLFCDYDVVVWVDANLIIKKNMDDLIREYPGDLCVPKHPDRDCIYEESKAIVRYCKDKKQNLDTQEKLYKEEGFPEHFGLNETNVIIRQQNDRVTRIMNLWADTLRKYSHRDQMSFNYALWKLQETITNISQEKRKEYFELKPHQKMR